MAGQNNALKRFLKMVLSKDLWRRDKDKPDDINNQKGELKMTKQAEKSLV